MRENGRQLIEIKIIVVVMINSRSKVNDYCNEAEMESACYRMGGWMIPKSCGPVLLPN
jgi:hypothetical protein